MMRFVKLSGGMLAATLMLLATSAFAETTLWLVRPLYPGQEALVERTEKALDKLIAATERKDHVIGRTELAAVLKGRKVEELPCLGVGERCADPIDPFVATLGFGRIVMVQGGQDEAGFKFRVVSYEPALNKVMPATSSAPVLEKALLGAVAKVVPVASTLEVKSTPSGPLLSLVKVALTCRAVFSLHCAFRPSASRPPRPSVHPSNPMRRGSCMRWRSSMCLAACSISPHTPTTRTPG